MSKWLPFAVSMSLVSLAAAGARASDTEDVVPIDSTAPAPTASASPSPSSAPQDAAAKPKKLDKAALIDAKRAYTAGELSYQAKDYKNAILNFRDAQSRIPTPHASFWLAMSLKADGQVPEAIAEFTAFVSNPNATKLGEAKVTEARAALEALKKTPGTLSVSTDPPGAIVALDGNVLPGVTPLPVEMTPGTHTITLSLAGYHSTEVQLEMPAGSKGEQSFPLEKNAPPTEAAAAPKPQVEVAPLPPPPPPPPRSLVPAYVLFGGAGLGLLTGAVFGAVALSERSKFDDEPTAANADAVERDALIADIALGASITLGLAGAAYVLAPASDSQKTGGTPKARAFAVAPYAVPQGAGFSTRLTF